MDAKEYIASGILESYVSGQCGEQEQREVQCMSSIYPEISKALADAEAEYEMLVRAYAVKAPANLKAAIMGKIQDVQPVEPNDQHAQYTSPDVHADQSATVIPISEAKEPIEKRATSTRLSLIWAAAAGLFLVLGVWQYFKYNSAAAELERSKQQIASISNALDTQREMLDAMGESLTQLYQPHVRKVALNGMRDDMPADIIVFWDTQSGLVSLDATPLPRLPTDKQYQLWVLIDGNPIDMGVLPLNSQGLLTAEVGTLKGDAFAVTIEPLGGQPTPSLDQLVLLGNIG